MVDDQWLPKIAEEPARLLPMLAVWAVAILAGLILSTRRCRSVLRLFWRGLARASSARGGAVAPWLAGIASLLFALPLIIGREPEPQVHDEFSYLLAADTFARGRLSNPTPVGWPAFEMMHTLMTPTYASKYPPGQGLLLAAGQVLTGRPVVGAWVGLALACAAITWMLQARLPSRWALLGGLLMALHPQALYWGQSYWGGQLAMLGGALLLGAALRLARRGPEFRLGLVGASGIALLAVTRPSEGALFALAIGAWTLTRWIRLPGGVRVGVIIRRAVVPAACVLVPLFAALAFYNARVTGSPLVPPYIEHIRQYGVAPPFVFQAARPEPNFRSAEIRALQAGWEYEAWQRQQRWPGYLLAVASKVYSVVRDAALVSAMPLLLAAALAAWPRDHRVRLAATGLVAYVGLIALTQTWTMDHYVAPAAGLLIVLAVSGARHLRAWRCHRGGLRVGRVLARAAVIVAVSAAVAYEVRASGSYGWHFDRRTLIEQLEQKGGKHVIIVRYGPSHDFMREWVANTADLQSQTVVFCREVDPETMRRVLDHFRAEGRRLWLLKPDEDFFRLTPLS